MFSVLVTLNIFFPPHPALHASEKKPARVFPEQAFLDVIIRSGRYPIDILLSVMRK